MIRGVEETGERVSPPGIDQQSYDREPLSTVIARVASTAVEQSVHVDRRPPRSVEGFRGGLSGVGGVHDDGRAARAGAIPPAIDGTPTVRCGDDERVPAVYCQSGCE